MSRWEKVRLGELTKIRTGKLDANANDENGRFPFFTCAVTPLRIDSYSYDCECVLVAGNGDLNVKYYKGKFDAYQRTYIIESLSSDRLYLPYLYRFLQMYITVLRTQTSGGVIQYIRLNSLTDARLPLPPVHEQKRIAQNLDLASEIVKGYKEQLAELDKLVQSVFYEMFGDPMLNPFVFPISTLGNLADVISGITKGRKLGNSQQLFEVPYMAVSNVKAGYIDWTTVKTIIATQEEIERYRIFENDILMTEGGDPDKLGRGSIINKVPQNCIHQNHIFRVRCKTEGVIPQYFSEYLKHASAKQYFLRCAKQTTGIASINMTQLRSLPVIVPPLPLQTRFASIVTDIEAQKAQIQQALTEAENLFNSLMQEYFE